MDFWDSANQGVNSGMKLGVKAAKKKEDEQEVFFDDLNAMANEQVRRENAKLGAKAYEEEEEEEPEKKEKSGMNPSQAYKMYKKYAGNSGSSAIANRSEGAIEMTPAESSAAAGDSGGMGSVGNVLAIIYAADQIKKGTGGYNRTESVPVLGADSHYHYTKPETTEIPWDEKTTQQKATDAPGGVGAVGGEAITHILGLTSDSDTGIGKYYKEMSRIEKAAFEPITKIISWLGLDVNPEGEGIEYPETENLFAE
ncbi:MAG: hypothetical protein A4E71_00098 [Smithella sp. PtaU1.Bin162]|nr:MAG: hypothetical protein A4E71_00098 [Smithella sp. PtaU1.Bin162]